MTASRTRRFMAPAPVYRFVGTMARNLR
jgi:hypothetical protein